MSPRTVEDRDVAVHLVRNLFAVSPSEAAEFIATRRESARHLVNRPNPNRTLAMAYDAATDAAENVLNELRAGAA